MMGAPLADETDLLSRVTLRLLQEHERPEFDRLLEEKHYLHEATLTSGWMHIKNLTGGTTLDVEASK